MKLKKLLDIKEASLAPDTIFRCNRATYPYEDKVDFIIRRDTESESGFSVMAVSGSQAGKTFQQLPKDCLLPPDTPPYGGGISASWLQDNWNTWVYPDCPVEFVEVYQITF